MNMGTQLSWLEHTPDKREVGGSSPLVPTKHYLVQTLTDVKAPQIDNCIEKERDISETEISIENTLIKVH